MASSSPAAPKESNGPCIAPELRDCGHPEYGLVLLSSEWHRPRARAQTSGRFGPVRTPVGESTPSGPGGITSELRVASTHSERRIDRASLP
eukprot:2411090-Alexandrium_andersonii.AAC.1